MDMQRYAIIMKPLSNIAFEADYHRLCIAELALVLRGAGTAAETAAIEPVQRGARLVFSHRGRLEEHARESLARLSFFYMLFRLEGADAASEIWHPEPFDRTPVFPDDLSTRLKYNGKTNEAITRLMLNVALALGSGQGKERPEILDPMCGKGTTLFEALIDGCNAYGVDVSKQALHDMSAYFSRYLKEGRYKHRMEKGKALSGGKNLGDTVAFSVAGSREAAKEGDYLQLKCIAADAAQGPLAFKKGMMDAIVCDLPYGIAHIGRKGRKAERSLAGILGDSLEAWDRALSRDGILALAWNTYSDSREDILACLEAHGFLACSECEGYDFSHRVSQAIHRDLVFARKK